MEETMFTYINEEYETNRGILKNRKENLFISLLKKIKDLFIKKDTNMQESK